MKILFVLEWFFQRSGFVKVASDLAKELSKFGHDVTLLTTTYDFDENFAKRLEQSGVNIINFKCKIKFANFIYSPDMKHWLNNHIKEFDIIHMHDYRTYQNIIVYTYAKKNNIPYILQPHGALPYIYKPLLKRIFDRLWGYDLLTESTKIIALTHKEAEQCKMMGIKNDHIKIIPNGIDISEYKNLPIEGIFRKRLDLNNNEKLVLYLGRLHKIKGIDLLVKAFGLLNDELKNVKLIIAGPDSGILPHLNDLTYDLGIDDKVIFIGSLYGKEKLEAYVDADVLVYPSFYEIFGLVPLEALMCNTSVIVTKTCGCSEFIDKLNCGYLVEYGNLDDLKYKIKKILQNPENENIIKCKNHIQNNLSWIKIAKEVENCYNDSIN